MPAQMPGGTAATGSYALPAGNYISNDFLDDELIHIACEIGGIAVEMMVDTGAQSSVISKSAAQRLNLMGRLDTSRQGVASGVGTARILGRLRAVPVKIGQVEFQLDFTVLAVEEQLLMLGIDQLRRFKCVVDLERQRLVFGGSGGVEVPFLPPSPSRLHWRGMGCPTM
jgi:DNA damage-inducible protein 1